MNTSYQVRNISKKAEQDTFEDGCLPETSQFYELDLFFSRDTVAALIKELSDWFGAGYQVNPYGDEPNRVDFFHLENEVGLPATKGQLHSWKMGKCKLYATTYTVYVEQVTEDFEMVL